MIDVHENCCDRCGVEMQSLQADLFDGQTICLDCVMSQRINTRLTTLPAECSLAWNRLAPMPRSMLRAARLAYERSGTLSDALFRNLETVWRQYQ